MTRRKGLLALLVLSALLTVSFVVSRRDRTPPAVEVRLEPRVIAERTFEVSLSADEPVTYTVRYGDAVLTRAPRDEVPDTLFITGLPGPEELTVTATDAAGNSSESRYPVYGVPLPQPLVKMPKAVLPGEPFGVRVVWAPGSVRASLTLSLDGQPLEVFEEGAVHVGLASVPLGTPPGEGVVNVKLADEYGREVHVTRPLIILADPRPVQELAMPAALLASSTPENEALEAQVLQDAYARAAQTPLSPPLEPFLLPLAGRSTSPYGAPRRYERGGAVSHHEGADLAAPVGTPVGATNAGRVLVADFFPIKGGLVMIDHGAGVISLYFHLSKLTVAAGDRVGRGDVVGEVGSTGRSTGPHLHWEMRVGGVASDPLAWVDKVLP